MTVAAVLGKLKIFPNAARAMMEWDPAAMAGNVVDQLLGYDEAVTFMVLKLVLNAPSV